MEQVYLIRHGETQHNVDNVVSGYSDAGLSKTGWEQAREVGKLAFSMSSREDLFDIVYSSPIRRAVETAKCISYYCKNRKVEYIADFREIDYGMIQGLKHNDVEAREAFQRCIFDPTVRFPSGESFHEARLRVVLAMHQCLALMNIHQYKRVAVVTHHDIIRLVVSYFLNMELKDFRRLTFDNCSISLLEFGDRDEAWAKALNYTVDKQNWLKTVTNPWFKG